MRLERTYLETDIVNQRRKFRSLIAVRPGMQVLDIGCGPGLLVSELALDVSPGGRVIGVDPSPEMLELAKRRCTPLIDEGLVELLSGEATSLPLIDSSFDMVTSTQVFEYVADIGAALAEARRVLAPGGRIAILDTDWDSVVWHCEDRERALRIYAAWEEHVADAHLPQTLTFHLHRSGFVDVQCTVIPIINLDLTPGTFGFSMRRNVHAFVPGRRGITQAEADAWLEDLETQARQGQYFFSANRYAFLAKLG
jgi:arsenite methyltransferase